MPSEVDDDILLLDAPCAAREMVIRRHPLDRVDSVAIGARSS